MPDDLGPFAPLTPMPLGFEASVPISALWVELFEILERFPARRDALKSLVGIDEGGGWPEHRLHEIIGKATAVAVQECIERGLMSIYVFNPVGGRFHKLPPRALVSEFSSTVRIGGQDTSQRAATTSETSWATGTLFEIDCNKSLFRLARERVPLMTSESEAQAVLEAFPHVLAKEAGQQNPEPLPSADPERRSKWIADLQARQRWPLREALLWIAMRDLDSMADIVLTALWKDNDPVGLPPPGVEWVLAHIDNWSDGHSFVEVRPDMALMRELRAGRVAASGIYEGREQRVSIDAHLWEDLEFGAWPYGQRSGSAARQRRQVAGGPWANFWTDILFDRDKLTTAFPVTESTDLATQADRDEWIAELMGKAKWSLFETLAWVAFRRPEAVAVALGPGAYWHGLLEVYSESRLDLLLSMFEEAQDATDRFPRGALEYALQRQGLTAAGFAPGGHATHRLEDLLRVAFWRADVLDTFPGVRETPSASTLPTDQLETTGLTEVQVRQLIIANSPPGSSLSQEKAVELVKRRDPAFDRESVRAIVRDISGRRGAGRPRKQIGG